MLSSGEPLSRALPQIAPRWAGSAALCPVGPDRSNLHMAGRFLSYMPLLCLSRPSFSTWWLGETVPVRLFVFITGGLEDSFSDIRHPSGFSLPGYRNRKERKLDSTVCRQRQSPFWRPTRANWSGLLMSQQRLSMLGAS